MPKILTLTAFLVGISCALAQSTTASVPMEPLATTPQVASTTLSPSHTFHSTPSPTSLPTSLPTPLPTPSPTPSPAPSPSSIPPHTSTPMPSPSPSPSPIPEETYKFHGPDGNVCIHMMAGLKVTVNYTTENGTTSTSLDQLSPNLRVDTSASMCNTIYARLVLVYTVDPHFNFTFTFNDTTKNVTWQDGNTTFQYKPTGTYLPGYSYSDDFEYDKIDFGDGVLFNGQNIEMQRSYKCDRAQYFNGSGELTNHTINATLTVTDFRVQVFQFLNNASNGTFDEARNCDNGNTSKIVPIAVGAALAGLVIVVLIAYLIGRFRNRKQSSYEALS